MLSAVALQSAEFLDDAAGPSSIHLETRQESLATTLLTAEQGVAVESLAVSEDRPCRRTVRLIRVMLVTASFGESTSAVWNTLSACHTPSTEAPTDPGENGTGTPSCG